MVAPPWYELPPTGYGGLELIVAALVDGLVERGHDVTLFGAGNRTGTSARFVSTTGELQYPRLGELMPAVLHTARVNRLIADGDFDVVHDHTTDGPMTAPTRVPPTVVTAHGAVDGEYGDYFATLGDAVRLVAISRAQRLLRPELAWAATVHNALPSSDIQGHPPTPDGPVVWLARFTPDKGPDLAVDACEAAGLPLVLAGKCNEPEEERYLDEEIRPKLDSWASTWAGSAGRRLSVQLLLNPGRPDTMRLLREARCLIMPIRWAEPFGMVMIEAMAVGTPVVALSCGAVPELVRHGVTGWIADSPEELPGLLRRAGEIDPADCVRHVQANFSAGVMARRYERVYLDELARREPEPGPGMLAENVPPADSLTETVATPREGRPGWRTTSMSS
jgi:glycosyltransferase involved in cell wall biosynthesis